MKNGLRLTAFALMLTGFFLPTPAGAASVQRIVVPAHDIARGEVISAGDVTAIAVNGLIPQGTVTAAGQVVGLETRRVLRAGESLRVQDFRHPVIISKGAMVNMLFEAPGVSLSATMRAISAGGVGDIVTVQNPVSFRQVTAIVMGPGEVKAIGGGMTITPDQEPVSASAQRAAGRIASAAASAGQP